MLSSKNDSLYKISDYVYALFSILVQMNHFSMIWNNP